MNSNVKLTHIKLKLQLFLQTYCCTQSSLLIKTPATFSLSHCAIGLMRTRSNTKHSVSNAAVGSGYRRQNVGGQDFGWCPGVNGSFAQTPVGHPAIRVISIVPSS